MFYLDKILRLEWRELAVAGRENALFRYAEPDNRKFITIKDKVEAAHWSFSIVIKEDCIQ